MQVGKRDQRVELYLGCSLLEFKSLTGEHYSTKTGIGAAFNQHRQRAKRRGIPFLLSFPDWWGIWQASGHWGRRGRHANEYCMARIGDTGAYVTGNVAIKTAAENMQEKLHNNPAYMEKARVCAKQLAQTNSAARKERAAQQIRAWFASEAADAERTRRRAAAIAMWAMRSPEERKEHAKRMRAGKA